MIILKVLIVAKGKMLFVKQIYYQSSAFHVVFFYFITKNFKYERNVCDGCFHCIIYETENKNLIFRIVTIKKGTFRTVSSYFLKEVEDILEKANTTRKFGWLYIEDLTSIQHNNETKK